MTAKRTVTWTGKTKSFEVQIEVTREMVDRGIGYADGWEVKLSGKALSDHQAVTAYADGAKVGTAYLGHIEHVRPVEIHGSVVVATIGQLGLTAERLAPIEAAIAEATAEAESDPEVMAYRAAEHAEIERQTEDDRHAAEVDRMMTLDGHTY